MIYVSIFAFALALIASACGVAALIISLRLRPALERWQLRTESDLTKLVQRSEQANASALSALRDLETRTPTKLAAEVAALAAALDSLAAQHRKLSGQFHATKHPHHAAVANGDTDDELQAMLAFQQAPPVDPAKRQ